MQKTKTVIKKSVMPIYISAIAFIIISIIFPMYKLSNIFIGLSIMMLVYIGLTVTKVFKDKEVTVTYEEPEFFVNKEVEEIVLEGRNQKKKLEEMIDRIENEISDKHVESIVVTHQKIIDYIQEHPDNAKDIRKYQKYYVPMVIQLLEHFDELEKTEFESTNVTTGKEKVLTLLESTDLAFKKQLDGLLEKKTIDISVDASVLETLMKQEGLMK